MPVTSVEAQSPLVGYSSRRSLVRRMSTRLSSSSLDRDSNLRGSRGEEIWSGGVPAQVSPSSLGRGSKSRDPSTIASCCFTMRQSNQTGKMGDLGNRVVWIQEIVSCDASLESWCGRGSPVVRLWPWTRRCHVKSLVPLKIRRVH
ncbi:hypothetical protein TNCV_2759761 [Trichonephila clavipes]|nr:hypothetical protein TNCV_2759761 [Trichonephila clavipes]